MILGTNHFGQATSTVVTRKDFETPLGITQTDRVFIEELQARCGSDLCQNEVDHQREHSVELQILMLQHVLGAENFTIVPTICPDPCGPTGTKPWNGQGVDLRVFAEQLGQMIRETTEETIIVTGADLSHIGMRFGDEKQLDADFCNQIEQQDRRTLEAILTGNPSQFLETVTSHQNSTRICSVGCLYAMVTALAGNRGELLRYHQAIDADNGVGVSCASMAFWND